MKTGVAESNSNFVRCDFWCLLRLPSFLPVRRSIARLWQRGQYALRLPSISTERDDFRQTVSLPSLKAFSGLQERGLPIAGTSR